MATVKVKFGGRLLKLRPSSMTTRNLAMIFKLDENRGIYLNCEEGEIILPSTDSDGLFEVDDLEKTYLVNGDLANANTLSTTTATSPLSPQSLPIGLPLSYQPETVRTSFIRTTQLMNNLFTFSLTFYGCYRTAIYRV